MATLVPGALVTWTVLSSHWVGSAAIPGSVTHFTGKLISIHLATEGMKDDHALCQEDRWGQTMPVKLKYVKLKPE